MARTTIYALVDATGTPFYVGKTVNLTRRMSCYKRREAHGNRELKKKLSCDWSSTILAEVDGDGVKEEMDFIQSIPGLVNKIREIAPLYLAPSDKPWIVKGAKCPTSLYITHMRNAFSDSCDELKQALKTMNDEQRFNTELYCADFMSTRPGKAAAVRKWFEGVENASA